MAAVPRAGTVLAKRKYETGGGFNHSPESIFFRIDLASAVAGLALARYFKYLIQYEYYQRNLFFNIFPYFAIFAVKKKQYPHKS
jgi:hypothetical protein